MSTEKLSLYKLSLDEIDFFEDKLGVAIEDVMNYEGDPDLKVDFLPEGVRMKSFMRVMATILFRRTNDDDKADEIVGAMSMEEIGEYFDTDDEGDVVDPPSVTAA